MKITAYSVIERWSCLQGDQYFTQDLNVTTDRLKKISLQRVFERSIALLRADSTPQIPSGTSLISAVNNSYNRFNRAFRFSFTGIFWKNSVIERKYNEFREELAKIVANKISQSGLSIKSYLDRAEPVFQAYGILRHLTGFLRQTIVDEMGKNNLVCTGARPPIYEILDDEKKRRGFLIGTCHMASEHNCTDSTMWPVVDQCKEVVSELHFTKSLCCYLDISIWCYNMWGWFCNRHQKQFILPDMLIARRALNRGISISGLESLTEQLLTLYKLRELDKPLSETEEYTNAEQKVIEHILWHRFAVQSELHEAWMKGDEAELSSLIGLVPRSCEELVLGDRNRVWLDKEGGMGDKLSAADPDHLVCFAVGMGHLYGESGLIEGLKSRGCVVKNVSPPPLPPSDAEAVRDVDMMIEQMVTYVMNLNESYKKIFEDKAEKEAKTDCRSE